MQSQDNETFFKRISITLFVNQSFCCGFFFFRCVDIGKYQMLGNNILTCIHSEWNGIKPICTGLNQENDYASMLNHESIIIVFALI